MLTIVTIAVPIVLVAIIAAIWWVVRDPTPPPRPPGCHRRRRDPHDPIRGDDGNRQSSTTSSCRHGTARGAEEVSAPLACLAPGKLIRWRVPDSTATRNGPGGYLAASGHAPGLTAPASTGRWSSTTIEAGLPTTTTSDIRTIQTRFG